MQHAKEVFQECLTAAFTEIEASSINDDGKEVLRQCFLAAAHAANKLGQAGYTVDREGKVAFPSPSLSA